MRLPKVPERTVAHIATAIALLCLAAAMTSGPLAQALQTDRGPQAAATATAEPENLEGPLTRRLAGAESISSRGGQRLPQVSDLPATDYSWTPSPTETATSTPRPEASPSPTAKVPTPTATSVPRISIPARTPTPNPGPPAPARVGIQAGHWKNSELPAELAGLRGSTGAAGKGWREVDINLDISQRAAALLQTQGVTVDLIPATVPVRYKADVFVSVHGDANSNTSLSGYKLARATASRIPARDDALLNAISSEYAAATGLRNHPATITRNMTSYYAFSQGLQHAVDATTPSVILELGFLTTAGDRQLLMEQPDRAAQGIANGILKFLGRR